MQLATDSALAAAVGAADRMIVSKLEIDWGRTGNFDHVLSDVSALASDINRQSDALGMLPPETTTLEGFATASLDFQLSGNPPDQNQSIAQLLSPINSKSPLYGQGRSGVPVRWRVGLVTAAGTVPMVDQFLGRISTIQVVSDQTVSIRCLDNTNQLRQPINLPLYWMRLPLVGEANQHRYRINSQWVIDYVLRRNGVYLSPPAPSTAIYSATGHGSLIPEIGHNFYFYAGFGSCTEEDPVVAPGRWGLAYSGSPRYVPVFLARANGAFRAVPSTSWLMQFQLDMSKVGTTQVANLITIGTDRQLFSGTMVSLRIAQSGQLFVDFYNGVSVVATVNGPTFTAPVWTDVWVHITFGASLANSIVSFPGMTVNPVNLSGLSSAPPVYNYAIVQTYAPLPIQAIQISETTSTGLVTYDPNYASQCDLDPGIGEFYSLPIRRGTDSLELIKEVVGSEFGVAGYSESGRFYFRNRDTVRKNSLTVEKALTPDPEVNQLTVSERLESVRNVIATPVRPVFLEFNAYTTVWATRDPNEILAPPGTSYWRVVLDSSAVVNDNSSLAFVTTANWDTNPAAADDTHQFCAVDFSLGTEQAGTVVSVITSPTQLALGMDEVILVVTNPVGNFVVFRTTDNRPALRIGGNKPANSPEQTATYKRQSSINQYGAQGYSLEANDWRQALRAMQPLALGLLRDLKAPIPVLTPITAVGDPRLQLLDTVELSDVQGLGGPVWTNTEALQRKLSGGKLEDTLTLRLFASPGKWLLGHHTQSILGVTTIPG